MTMGSEHTRTKIVERMAERFKALHTEAIDETWKHAGHAGALAGGGHFILLVVSDHFEGVNLLNRNRMVFEALQHEMGGEIHALSIKALTPAEWEKE